MNTFNTKTSRRNRKQAGQGMTEYIIIVALVAIGAIGVYSAFGRTVQSQMAAVTNGLAGHGAPAPAAIHPEGTAANLPTPPSGPARRPCKPPPRRSPRTTTCPAPV